MKEGALPSGVKLLCGINFSATIRLLLRDNVFLGNIKLTFVRYILNSPIIVVNLMVSG
jgi:hypothetical protein